MAPMRRFRAEWALALWLLLPAASDAAVCTFDSPASVAWSAITDASQLDCPTSGGGDDFVVPAGTTVDAVGAILWSTTTPGIAGARLTVEAGGTFSCRLANGCTELALDRGLICLEGSTCILEGLYPELGVPLPGLVDTAELQGVFPAGDVVPCPGWDADGGAGGGGRFEPDCDGLLADPGDVPGDRNEMALVYRLSEWGGAFAAETLANLQAGDVLLWKDADVSTALGTPVDEGFAYEIVEVDPDYAGAGSHGVVVLDVRQTDPAAPRSDAHYPDVLRQVATGSLNAGLAGSSGGSRGRVLDVDPGVLPGTTEWLTFPVQGWKREERAGMYVRFDCAGDGIACDEVFRISRTWNAAPDGLAPVDCAGGAASCDLLELYSPRGLPWDLPAGTRFWIDYGWRRGDTFSVYRPIRVHSAGGVQAVPRNGDPPLYFGTPAALAPHRIRAVIYEDGTLRYAYGADGTGAVMEDFWFRDPYHGGGATLVAAEGTQNWSWKRVHRSGGAMNQDGVDHGFTWGKTGSLNGWDLEELGWRHGGDDWISAGGQIGGPDSDMRGRRIRFQYASNGSASQQYASSNGRIFHLELEDGECVQCATPRTGVLGAGSADYRGLLFVSPLAGGGSCGRIEDFLSVGTGLNVAPSCPIERFVVAQTDSYANVGGIRGFFDATRIVDAADGVIRDFGYVRSVFENHFDDAASLRNILVLDYYRTDPNLTPEDHQHAYPSNCDATSCSQLLFNSGGATPATAIDLDRITVAFRDDSTAGSDWAYRLNQTDVPNIHTLDGLLAYLPPGAPTVGRGDLVGLDGSNAEILSGFANTSRGPCIGAGYATVTSNDNEELLPPSAVLHTPLDLEDPSQERYGALPGGVADQAGCGIHGGALAPGLFRWRATNHWMGGVPPENASGAVLPQPVDEATSAVADWPGLVVVEALGGLGVPGGVEAAYFSPPPAQLEVAHYAPSAGSDLTALLGNLALRPPIASSPVRVWDFRFDGANPYRLTFRYAAAELLGNLDASRLAIYAMNPDGTWVELPSEADGETLSVVVQPPGLTRFALGVRQPQLPAAAWLARLGLAALLGLAAARRLARGR